MSCFTRHCPLPVTTMGVPCLCHHQRKFGLAALGIDKVSSVMLPVLADPADDSRGLWLPSPTFPRRATARVCLQAGQWWPRPPA
jgi:hypothetical protein